MASKLVEAVEAAKAKLEQALGGAPLAHAKAVVDELKAEVADDKGKLDADAKAVEDKAVAVKTAVENAAGAELKKLEKAEPAVKDAAKAALDEVVAAGARALESGAV